MAGRTGGQTTTTDSRSKRIRVSRRGGQVLTRARGPSNDYGLPDLRLLPDAPIPDGRTVLTEPEALNSCNDPVVGTRWHLAPFIPVTNAIEALNRQLRKAVKTKGHFPNEDAARKLIYLAIQNAAPQWTRTRGWTKALLAFKIHFGDRLPD
jgi:Transposase, Mutator family